MFSVKSMNIQGIPRMRLAFLSVVFIFLNATVLHIECQPWILPNSEFPSYGSPQSMIVGLFPNTEERQAMTWINFVRQAPIYYRNNYIIPFMASGDTSGNNILSSSSYSSVHKPIPYNINLGRSSRAHVVDRLNNVGCGDSYPHDDCNGTTTGTRINKFYSGYGWGEIWSGPFPNPKYGTYPWAGTAAFICDGSYWFTSSSLTLYSCPSDGTTDGHRNIIMNENGEFGCGILNNGSYSDFSCDFGPTQVSSYHVQIYSGSHVFVPPSTTHYQYLVNFYSTSAPSSSIVVIDGQSHNLTLLAGTSSNGVYVSSSLTYTSTEACHTYYFQFVVNNKTETYPSLGGFKTNYIGSCAIDWASNGGPGSVLTK